MYKKQIKDYLESSLLSSFDICLVDIPKFLSKINFSYVQIKQFNFNAKATNSTSLTCFFSSSLDLGMNSLYSYDGTNLTILKIDEINLLNPNSEILDLDNISFLLFKNSSFIFWGVNNSRFLLNINLIISPPEINVLNNTLESRTTFNYIEPSFFKFLYIESLTFLDNSSASLSVNLDLDTIFINSLNISCRLSSLMISFLANSDQFIQDRFFISDLISSGIANVKDVIYLTPRSLIYSNFLNCLTLDIIIFLSISDHLTPENLSIFSFNSFGIDKVIVAIFDLQPNYVYKHKYVNIYKDFAFNKRILRC